MQTSEEFRRNADWPEFFKAKGVIVHLFNPQGVKENPRTEFENYFIPYYKVKKEQVKDWLNKFEQKNPMMDVNKSYRGILLTFVNDGYEPMYGGAVIEVIKNKLN